MQFDVFNGDADGICALIQLRLAEPIEATLITGVKRDIALLQRVQAGAGDSVTVLDVSLDKNRDALQDLLQRQVEVFYVDHHQASDVPVHPYFKALIDTDAQVCTSLLVDRHLGHRFTAWAVAAAFGDNLEQSAAKAAESLGLSPSQREQLRHLGICINYNAYGSDIADLHIAPDRLYKELCCYVSPFDFIAEQAELFERLQEAYRADMAQAEQWPAEFVSAGGAVFVLPDSKWARRVNGVWSNALANAHPGRAHAVLTPIHGGDYQVSVRAPLNTRIGADDLCQRFPSGGGRKAAAGINRLPADQLSSFIDAFARYYPMLC